MKYSYPDSLIAVASAITRACSLYTNRNNKPVKQKSKKDYKFLKLNDKLTNPDSRVGIKFDNISAIKYFALIHKTQLHPVVNKSNWKVWWSILAVCHVTQTNDFKGLTEVTSHLYYVNQLFFKRPLRWKRMVACKRGLGSGPLSFCP